MPVNFLDAVEQARLNRFPAEIVTPDIYTYFTLTEADKRVISNHRGEDNRLGFALQLTALRYLGFCPNDLQTTPKVGVAYLAQQLEVAPAVLATYGQRDKTRTQHTREFEEYLGFREASSEDLRELGQWLTERALEHDKPTTLLGLAAEKLRKGKIVRPGITRLVKLVASAREKAHIQTYRLLEPVLSEECCKFLDSLIKIDPDIATTRLEWLRQSATENSSKAILTNLAKLKFLREAAVANWKLTGLNPNRRKFLTTLGRKANPFALARLANERRYPLLLAFVVQSLEDITDETLDLFIAYLDEANRRAETDLAEFRLSRARAMDEKVRHFQALGSFILSGEISDEQLRPSIYGYVERERLSAQVEECKLLVRPADNTHFDFLLKSYKAIRHFSLRFLQAFTFYANPM